MDSLIALLLRDMNTLPADIQGYAKKLVTDAAPGAWFATSQILSELKINEVSTSFVNGWPFEFTSPAFPQVTQASINSCFGLIAAYSMALLPQLTTQFTFYLTQDLLLIFYLDVGGAQIGSFISPGYANTFGDCGRNLTGSWKHLSEPGSALSDIVPYDNLS